MTCGQFKKKLFKMVGAKITSREAKTFNKHTEVCESCRKVLLYTVSNAVDKHLKERGY
jgi:hypothetical protein